SRRLGDVLGHLVFPVWPVMATHRSPVVKRMANSLAGENFRETVTRATVLPRTGAGANVNVTRGNLLIKPGITHVGEVIDRVVKIKIVIVHSVHKISYVINAGHGKTPLDDIGVFEQRVRGVVSAERCSHRRDGDAWGLAIVPDEGNDFFTEVGIENRLHVAAMKRMRTVVVEAEAVDGIDGEEFDFSSINEVSERVHHALAFQLELVTGACRKTEKWRAPVAVDDDT